MRFYCWKWISIHSTSTSIPARLPSVVVCRFHTTLYNIHSFTSFWRSHIHNILHNLQNIHTYKTPFQQNICMYISFLNGVGVLEWMKKLRCGGDDDENVDHEHGGVCWCSFISWMYIILSICEVYNTIVF